MALTPSEVQALFDRATSTARRAKMFGPLSYLQEALALVRQAKTAVQESTLRPEAKQQLVQELDQYEQELNREIENERSSYNEATSKFQLAVAAANTFLNEVQANPSADPAPVIQQLQDAKVAIQNSGLSDSEKAAKIAELDGKIAQVNRAAGRPVVAPTETTNPPAPATNPEEQPVENPAPQEVGPEELRGEGYRVPTDEELSLIRPPEYDAPPDVTPEELTGAGYDIPAEPEGPLLLTPPGSGGGGGGSRGLFGGRAAARASGFIQDQYKTNSLKDWRVRLTLAPNSKYLYNDDTPGILAPLKATNGVVFPYTPSIQTTYAANYEGVAPTHSNFKIFQYGASSVDQVSITCDFTAQDTFEANYLLAVIHFFRSVTKMFYGQDNDPKAGTPPPLVFLEGMGAFQYNKHPLVINNFTYSLPNDCDYIRAYLTSASTGQTGPGRLGSTISPGGIVPKTVFNYNAGNSPPTYVPTRIQLQVSAYPIVTRNRISNEFSLKKYGTGELVNKGIW